MKTLIECTEFQSRIGTSCQEAFDTNIVVVSKLIIMYL